MTKDEQFAFISREILDKINSWADLYEFFDAAMRRVRETAHPTFVFDGLFTMYAFFNAMREMPDEGDIKKLVLHMLKIMVYESEEKLGVKLTIMNTDEMKRGMSDQALSAMISFSTAEPPPKDRLN